LESVVSCSQAFPNRIPRRDFDHQHSTSTHPIVGSSGSIPLHFAAANGHADVVCTLLFHGAHADCADKHGVTLEIARENGKESTADLFKEWLENIDKDSEEPGAEAGNASESESGLVTDKRTSCIGRTFGFPWSEKDCT
jgi:hypothetical protein